MAATDVICIQREFGTRRIYVKFASQEVYSRVLSSNTKVHTSSQDPTGAVLDTQQAVSAAFVTESSATFSAPT